MDRFVLYNRDSLDDLFRVLRDKVEVGPVVVHVKKKVKQRTITQNKALHKYFEIISEKMNDGGIDQKELIGNFKDGFSLPVTPDMIKSIFREVGNAMFKKDSTAKLTTVEIQKVYEIFDKRIGEVTGVRADWPSDDDPLF